MAREKFLKLGGQKFRPLVKPQEINSYVDSLPAEKRESMFEVARELQDKKMIEILPDSLESSRDHDTCL